MARSVRVRLNNPRLLRWARESAGLTVEEIAAHLDKAPETIRRWEAGQEFPTYRQLEEFARKVHRPVAALFLPEVPREPPPPADYRVLRSRQQGSFTPATRLALRMLGNNLRDLRELTDALGEALRLSLPEWTLDHDPSRQATLLRARLGVPFEAQMAWRNVRQAFEEWRRVLFGAGVLVQTFPIPLEDARGFSLLEHGLGGIGISGKDALAAMVFSLFHEVAHVCLRRPGVSGEMAASPTGARTDVARLERHCNQFAAAFLLPGDHPRLLATMEELAADFTRDHADASAKRLKVSKYVLGWRMLDLGKLPGRYRREISAWPAEDRERDRRRPRTEGGPHHVTVRVSQVGRPFLATVLEAVERQVLTPHEAGRVLSLRPRYLEQAAAMLT